MLLSQIAKLTDRCVGLDPTASSQLYHLVIGTNGLETVKYAQPLLHQLHYIDEAHGLALLEIKTAIGEWSEAVRQTASGGAASVASPKRRSFVLLFKVMHMLYDDDPRTLGYLEGLASGGMELHETVFPDDLRRVRLQLSRVQDKFGEQLPELAGDAVELIDRIDRYLED